MQQHRRSAARAAPSHGCARASGRTERGVMRQWVFLHAFHAAFYSGYAVTTRSRFEFEMWGGNREAAVWGM
jgi:hypothetical protein